MDDAAWKEYEKIFPGRLKGSRVDTSALPDATEKQPPFICGAFSPDAQLIALSGGGRIPCNPGIWIAKVPSLETAMTLYGHQGVHALAWDAETHLLAAASNDYTAVLWDLQQGDNLFAVGGDDEPIVKGHVAFGKRALYVGETEAFGLRARLLRVSLDRGTVETLATLQDAKDPRARIGITHLAVDPATDRWAYASGNFDDAETTELVVGSQRTAITEELAAIHWRGGSLVQTPRSPDVDRVAVAPDGQTLFSASGDRVIAAGPTASWSITLPAPEKEKYRTTTLLTCSPGGEYLAVAGFGLIAILDAKSGALIASRSPPAWVHLTRR